MTLQQSNRAEQFESAINDEHAIAAAVNIINILDNTLNQPRLFGLEEADTTKAMHSLVYKEPNLQWIVYQSVDGEPFLPVEEYNGDKTSDKRRIRLYVISSNPRNVNLSSMARLIREAAKANGLIRTVVIASTKTAEKLAEFMQDVPFEIV